MPSQTVRVVVRLPYNRPDQPISDPPKVRATISPSRMPGFLLLSLGRMERREGRHSLESDRKISRKRQWRHRL